MQNENLVFVETIVEVPNLKKKKKVREKETDIGYHFCHGKNINHYNEDVVAAKLVLYLKCGMVEN